MPKKEKNVRNEKNVQFQWQRAEGFKKVKQITTAI